MLKNDGRQTPGLKEYSAAELIFISFNSTWIFCQHKSLEECRSVALQILSLTLA